MNLFVGPDLVVFDQAVRRLTDLLCASVVLGKDHLVGVRVLFLESKENPEIGASKAKDGLKIVTHGE